MSGNRIVEYSIAFHLPGVLDFVAAFEVAFFAGTFLLEAAIAVAVITGAATRFGRPAAAVASYSFPFAEVIAAGASAVAAESLVGVFAFAEPFFGGMMIRVFITRSVEWLEIS